MTADPTPHDHLPKTCNRHDDCDRADEEAKAKANGDWRDPRYFGADHCHSEDCDECFGS